LKDGYAPFCKHIFLPCSAFEGFEKLECSYAEITDDNKDLIQTTYSARTEKELPVLTRFFKQSVACSQQSRQKRWLGYN
jgi:hypothetical protein